MAGKPKKRRTVKVHNQGGNKFTVGDTLGDSKGKKETGDIDTSVFPPQESKKNVMQSGKGTREGKKGYERGKLVSPDANDSL